MKDDILSNLIDKPKIIDESTDIFGTYEKAITICNFLSLDDNKELLENHNMIAIYGHWGVGKSSVMETIRTNLNENDFDTLWFETWKYENDTNLAYSLFKYILKKNDLWGESKTKIENVINSFVKSIGINFGVISFSPKEALENDEKFQERLKSEACLWEKIEEFEKNFKDIKLKSNTKRLIVFLDDLDRCESENIINLMSTIKMLLSINKKIIFVLGVDKSAVTLALKNKYQNDDNTSEEYLEKLFPINFDISNNVNTENFKKYIRDIAELEKADLNLVCKFFEDIKFSNARHLKKVISKYVFMKNYLKSKNIDVSNGYVVTLILYIIILKFFFEKEYQHLIMKNREVDYYPIEGIECIIKKEGNHYRIYDFLVRFSSCKGIKKELQIKNGGYIEYYDWIALFPNNICKDFIEFVPKDEGFLKFIVTQDYDKLIQQIHNIL